MPHKFIAFWGLAAALAAPEFLCAESEDRKTIREIRVNGLIYTHEQLVRDQLTSAVGQPYDEATIELDRERLDRLAVFSRINIEPVT